MLKFNFNFHIKRFFVFVLLMTLSMSICVFSGAGAVQTSVTGTTENLLAAVYAYADYEISLKNAVFAEGGNDDGTLLTDVKFSSAFDYFDDPIDGWVKIRSYNNEADYKAIVDIDLGYSAKGINTFYTRNYQYVDKGIGFPDTVEYYVSRDGEDFEYVGDGICDEDPESKESSAIFRLITEDEYEARYIRAVFKCNGREILYINEVAAGAKGRLFYANYSHNEVIRDSQGVLYRIDGNIAEVIGFDNNNVQNNNVIEPSDISFNKNGITYTLGMGSDNPVTVYTDFINEEQKNYSGSPNSIKYIVIHNTATTAESTDAKRYNSRLHQTDGTSSWHYTVDDNVIYHSLPDNIVGWHAGPTHNYESIGIEMCVNGAPANSKGLGIFEGAAYDKWVEERFRKTIKNTAMLTAELLTRYGLGTDAVIQHYDVSQKDCPQWLRANGEDEYNGELWLEFMDHVEEYYHLLNGDDPKGRISSNHNIKIPDFIRVSSGKVYPVESIASGAFSDIQHGIQSIELGKHIKRIEADSFLGCESLEIVSVSYENDNFHTDSNNILYDNEDNIIFPTENKVISPNPLEGCTLEIKEIDGRYCLITNGKDLKINHIELDYGAGIGKAYNAKGERLLGSSIVGTDTVICFDDGLRLYAVHKGDVDGDGKISSIDYILTKRIYYETYKPTKRQLTAVSFTNGVNVTMTDYIMLKRHYFGTYNLIG